MRSEFQKLKRWRDDFERGSAIEIEVPKETNIGGLRALIMNETVTKTISTEEIPKVFGSVLSSAFGRAAGLAGPSWWLGRNDWVGRLAGAELAPGEEARLGSLQDLAIEASWNPSHLFEEVSPAGAEAGFSVTCPAYQTGLLFPRESCQALLASLQAQRGMWTELGRLVTGYAVDDVIGLQQMVEEALDYGAMTEGFLLEGDEIVGQAGSR